MSEGMIHYNRVQGNEDKGRSSFCNLRLVGLHLIPTRIELGKGEKGKLGFILFMHSAREYLKVKNAVNPGYKMPFRSMNCNEPVQYYSVLSFCYEI